MVFLYSARKIVCLGGPHLILLEATEETEWMLHWQTIS
jgi:hypothetical protein